ncbi:MAG: c-type cytochrome biogenesis protein CcmI [Hoeflea sp.]|uniref:c-type cytochrome biogenesis protein CcmI n=1 Tax=Hoeflea sp. TaxID=1940281 RepID=UPI0032F097C4
MLFWVIAAVMTALVTLALIGPVMRSRNSTSDAPELHDMEVYRDQLAEVDRDLSDGLIDAAQAEVARTEISRRLLSASRKSKSAEPSETRNAGLRRAAVIAVAVFMPLMAVTAYLELGRPDLPQLPLSARSQADPENTDLPMLVARAERHLAENPDDGRGWSVLAPIYLRLERFADSAEAFRKTIALLGPTPERLTNLGEALISAGGGLVTEEAKLAFQTARELDPNDPRPQFFLAVGLAQAGKQAEARAAFSAMIAGAPEGAPWIAAVEAQIAALDNSTGTISGPVSDPASGGQVAGSAAPGNPTAADIEAASNMSPEERQAMISSMIQSLEARLARDPDNIEGWLRLVRSHVVTGNRDKAQAALDRAFAVFARESAEKQSLNAIAREFGLVATSTLGGVPVAPADPEGQTALPAPDVKPATPFILEGARADDPSAGSGTDSGAAGRPSGPTQADIAAAAALSNEERGDMIRGMVASLDARLSENPDNLEGWLRLVRSYAVLGDVPAAASALERAQAAFPEGSEGGQALAELAGSLGIAAKMENQ